jgi:hypothetical protein
MNIAEDVFSVLPDVAPARTVVATDTVSVNADYDNGVTV